MSTPQIISGICWTIVYITLVYRSFKDKTYGMPIAALALNFTWEFTFSFIYPPGSVDDGGMALILTIINTVWVLFDCGLVVAFFKNGYKYFDEFYGVSQKTFYIVSIAAFVLCFNVMITGAQFAMGISDYFNNDAFEGAKLIAYIQNAIMSVIFVTFFFTRKKAGHSIEGQSFYAALAKLIGTSLTVGIEYIILHRGIYFGASLILICFIFDLWYCFLVYKELKVNGINPWKRI